MVDPNQFNPKGLILDHAPQDEFQEGQPVSLLIKDKTDLGYKAIVEAKYWGVLYFNEVFTVLVKDQKVQGFIKKIREDGKIDLRLYQEGHHGRDEIVPLILLKLAKSGGFLPFTEKTDPEKIYSEFGASKKKFKIAVSHLYKNRLIQIEPNGIRLVEK